MKAHALGRLLRLSLLPSAVADVVAGALLLGGVWPPAPELGGIVVASLGLYHGGMVLNDWADRHEDARLRPERPLPAGHVDAGFALVLGLALLATGILAASLVAPATGLHASALAAVVLLYDLGPRGPLLGPLLLGLARAGNLALGMHLATTVPERSGVPELALVLAPVAYGLYVFLVSRLGRLEDAPMPPAPGRTRRLLRGLAAILVLTPLVPLAVALPGGLAGRLALGAGLGLALGLLASVGLRRVAREDPRAPGEIVRAMGLALRRLLVVTASLAVLPGTPAACLGAACILAGYPLSHALRRVFPPS